ncbi:MAG: hypothetical protein QXS20_07115 [Candidatus Thorarchaeota archaeon]
MEVGIASLIVSSFVNVITRYRSIADWINGRTKVPVIYEPDDGRPRAVAVVASVDPTIDLKLTGYNVIAQIGRTKELSPGEMTRWAEVAAAVIENIAKNIDRKPLAIAFACPTAQAFMIGTILGHAREYRVLHWTGDEYLLLDEPDMNAFRRLL